MTDKFIVIDMGKVVCDCDTLEEARREQHEWDADHKYAETDIQMECQYCSQWYEIGDTCGCPESLDETEQWHKDRARDVRYGD